MTLIFPDNPLQKIEFDVKVTGSVVIDFKITQPEWEAFTKAQKVKLMDALSRMGEL